MLQRVSWALLPDALAKRCIYLEVTSPFKGGASSEAVLVKVNLVE